MSTFRKRTVRIVDPGVLSTVQDLGRRGAGRLGVSPGGSADWYSSRAANRLVGNPDSAALIETTLSGASFALSDDVWIAVTGASAPLAVGGRVCEQWRALRGRAGERVVVGAARRGLRSYVAFDGGVIAPPLLGSASTDVTSGFGGRIFGRGDEFSLGAAIDTNPGARIEPIVWQAETVLRTAWRAASSFVDPLFSSSFQVTDRSSRQAVSLEGEATLAGMRADRPSAGVCAGCVQVTADGTPIVLLCEHQTTGGYEIAAVVATADLPRAAQLRPGDRVRFEAIDIEEAGGALEERRRALDAASQSLAGPNDGSAVLAAGFFEGAES
ncbi:MAG TPA: biotin-dependent carboxyltransferase family protein [Candidatus Eremiobacteraceae bacterium]|nr:biotin-dependent carboxyltransferase family protein [Candidatus Eremiobacteraceae bacterium]